MAGQSRVVYIFGHYDSRGGTTAVVADDETTAKKTYAEWMFPGDEFGKDAADEDYLGMATLEMPTDLEAQIPAGADLEEWGTVAVEGRNPNDDYYEREGKPPGWKDDFGPWPPQSLWGGNFNGERLVLVPEGGAVPEGYSTPRWDDDAFGFLLIY